MRWEQYPLIKTRLDLWEKTDGKSGKPKLVYENHAMPVFYRDVMYREGAEGKDEAYLKLYDGHDWKWILLYVWIYGYGISEKMLVREKGICPDSGKETPEVFFAFFL